MTFPFVYCFRMVVIKTQIPFSDDVNVNVHWNCDHFKIYVHLKRALIGKNYSVIILIFYCIFLFSICFLSI